MTDSTAIGLDTLVRIRRELKNYLNSVPDFHGPKTLRQAIADNDLTTSSGTVEVQIYCAETGPLEGGVVFQQGGRWHACPGPAPVMTFHDGKKMRTCYADGREIEPA